MLRPLHAGLIALVMLATSLAAPATAATGLWQISGTLTALGVPVVDRGAVELVESLAGEESVVATATPGARGAFSFEVPNGSYLLRAQAGRSVVAEWYDDSLTRSGATNVFVAGRSVRLAPIDLQAPASITGTVTDPSEQPLPNIVVYAYSPGQLRYPDAVARTDESGHFTLDTGPGEWVLEFEDRSARYLTRWSGGSRTGGAAAVIHVGREDVEAAPVALPLAGTITGTVTYPGDPDFQRVAVRLLDLDGSVVDTADPLTGERYRFQWVEPGPYRVHFDNDTPSEPDLVQQYYPGSSNAEAAQVIEVVGGATTANIDATMVERPDPDRSTVEVTGVVTDHLGQPLSGIRVSAASLRRDPWGVVQREYTVTGDDGRYQLVALDPADDIDPRYLLTFTDGQSREFPSMTTYSGGGTELARATRLEVAAGRTVTEDVVVRRYGGLSIRMSTTADDREGGVTATLLDLDGNVVTRSLSAGVGPNEHGVVHIGPVPPGDYLVRFDGDVFSAAWWPGTADRSSATPVSILPGPPIEELRMTVLPGPGRIVGRASAEAGAVLTGGEVTAWSDRTTLASTTTIAEDGSFAFADLFPGRSYRLHFTAWGRNLSGEEITFVRSWWESDSWETAEVVKAAFVGDAPRFVNKKFVSRPAAEGTLAVLGTPRPGGFLFTDGVTWTPSWSWVSTRWVAVDGTLLSESWGYQPRPDDAGLTLRAVLTATADGKSTTVASPWVRISPNPSTTSATGTVAYRGKRRHATVRLRVLVTTDGTPATSRVEVLERGRVVAAARTSSASGVVLTVGRARAGTHRYVVRYAGSPSTQPSSTRLVVRVKKSKHRR